jgi:hypothetical protein
MDVPDIPSVNKQTSYLKLKDIIEETRKTVQESHLVDSDTARIVDNPGGTRSIVVLGTDTSQSGREVLVISPGDFIHYFNTPSPTETTTAVTWPNGTACAVDIGNQDINIGFLGYRVYSGNLYLRWTCFTGSGRSLGGDITITAFL